MASKKAEFQWRDTRCFLPKKWVHTWLRAPGFTSLKHVSSPSKAETILEWVQIGESYRTFRIHAWYLFGLNPKRLWSRCWFLDVFGIPNIFYLGNATWVWKGCPSCYECSFSKNGVCFKLGFSSTKNAQDGSHDGCSEDSMAWASTRSWIFLADPGRNIWRSKSRPESLQVSKDCSLVVVCRYGWQNHDLGLSQSAQVGIPGRVDLTDGITLTFVIICPCPVAPKLRIYRSLIERTYFKLLGSCTFYWKFHWKFHKFHLFIGSCRVSLQGACGRTWDMIKPSGTSPSVLFLGRQRCSCGRVVLRFPTATGQHKKKNKQGAKMC